GERVVQRTVPDSHEQVRLGGIGQVVGELIEEKTGIETRVTVLGHIQRGGSPSPYDRLLATQLGAYAAQLALEGKYGQLVALRQGKIQAVPLDQVETGIRTVPVDGPEAMAARAIGISFGDRYGLVLLSDRPGARTRRVGALWSGLLPITPTGEACTPCLSLPGLPARP